MCRLYLKQLFNYHTILWNKTVSKWPIPPMPSKGAKIVIFYPVILDDRRLVWPPPTFQGKKTTQVYLISITRSKTLHVCVYLVAQSCPTLCSPVGCSPPGSSVLGVLRQEYWSGLLFPSPGDLPGPWMESPSLASPALAGTFLTTSTTWKPKILHSFS